MTNFTIRARLFDFRRCPEGLDDHASYRYFEDGGLIIKNGKIAAMGEWGSVEPQGDIRDLRPYLVMPGFVDLHLHMPQMQVIASYAKALLDWLNDYTFPEESKFHDPAHANRIANALCDTLLTHGTTTAVAYCSSHPQSVEVYFAAAQSRGMCMIGGKVMMDRGAPDALCDTAQSSYDDSKVLISKWHGAYRLHYAISPRFCITSTPAQMSAAQSLAQEHPDCYIQTHIDENAAEIELTRKLYPNHRDYMGVYEDYGLLGEKTLLGHCIHMNDREIGAMIDTKSVAVHCPTSNLFLGSGLFDWFGLAARGARIGLATDIGGGTNYSMFRTMDEAYKIQQLRGQRLNPLLSYYTSTLGNAKALGLEADIGTLEVGSMADLTALDMRATPAMALRAETVSSLVEELFLLQTLGDDRAVRACFVAGNDMLTKIANK